MNVGSAPQSDSSLGRPVRYLRGVGPKRAHQLERLGVSTVSDLLRYYPRAWEDRRETAPPGPGTASPAPGMPLVLRGRILRAQTIPTRMPLALFKASLQVPSWEHTLDAVWFKRVNRRYDVFQRLKSDARPGSDLWIVGRAEPSLLKAREAQVEEHYRFDDPKSSLHVGRIVPLYPLTEGLQQRLVRELVAEALAGAKEAPEILPAGILRRRELLSTPQALSGIHYPRSHAELEEARRRLAYEELLLLELAFVLKQRQTQAVEKGYGYEIRRRLLTPFRRQMGFDFTGAQKRVINEIFTDMQAPHPMTRLLQGDVGSGKTVVAVASLLLAVENGFQGAFMAPTEILAEQHYWTMARFLKGLPVTIELLTSRVPKAARARILKGLESGEVDVVVGTHALLEEEVRFKSLRLSVIDEQHRFGVRQRGTLRRKGPPMDLLVMTATPIPRTLALALYGDLSVSTLDEMPPGRSPTTTRTGAEDEALARVRAAAAEGRQSYIVYPIIAESSRLDLKAARAEYERLRQGALQGLRVALIHGQLRGDQKADVMDAFMRREYDALVATPVIEVGVDVENATVMVIQNADRFGLASLHQLRGRVGRGSHPSECWLVGEPQTPEARRRLQTLCETNDGFRIGEEDLKLRGPGEILGVSQHGELTLQIADLLRDTDLLAQARPDARELLEGDPTLSARAHTGLRKRLLRLYRDQCNMVDLA